MNICIKFNFIYFKALQGLGSMHFIPGLQLQRQLNYTKCLVSDVSNAQNKGTEKTDWFEWEKKYGFKW